MDDLIYKLYIALFLRAPEKEGVDYWYRDLIKNSFNSSLIANEMIKAASNYSQYYPQYANINNSQSIKDIIENVYKILFNKSYEDDKEGIDYWVNDVLKYKDLGKVIVNIIEVADMIANKEISADEETYYYAVAFENKVEVAKYVSEKFNKFDGDFSKFQNFIKNVDASKESMENSIKEINANFNHKMTYDELSLGAKSLLINEGAKIQKDIITYSFPLSIPDDYKYDETLTNNWTPLNEKDKKLVREAFNELSKFLNVSFEEVNEDGDIRFSKIDMLNSNEAGFTIQEVFGDKVFVDGIGSDIFLSNNYDKSMSGEDVILHEIGHALGLKHPFEGYPTLDKNDNSLYTIMSYTQKETFLPDIEIQKNSNNINYVISTLPLGRKDYAVYDIEALEFLYGKKENNLNNNLFDESNLYKDYKFDVILDDGGIDTLYLGEFNGSSHIYLEGGDELSSIGESLPLDYIKDEVKEQLISNNLPLNILDEIYENILNNINQNSSFKDLIYQGKETLTLPKSEIENFNGGLGSDYIEDNDLDNVIFTNEGDDTIIINHKGNDFIDGGEGFDILEIYDDTSYEEFKYDDITYLVFEDKVVAFSNIEDFYVI